MQAVASIEIASGSIEAWIMRCMDIGACVLDALTLKPGEM
jgi:hypothetical protein